MFYFFGCEIISKIFYNFIFKKLVVRKTKIPAIFVVLLFMLACQSHVMNKEEAERSLKVLNSDLLNFAQQVSEKDEFLVLDFLLENENAPFPVFKNDKGFISVKSFDFSGNKGRYSFSGGNNDFLKIEESESIEISFQQEELSDLVFVLTEFDSEMISSGEKFPVKMFAEIRKNTGKIWDLEYSLTISDGLPEIASLKINGDKYQINAALLRTKNNDKGTVEINCDYNYLNNNLISTRFFGQIGYSRQGYYFNQIEFRQKLFGHFIDGFCDYEKVNPTADNYAASFNAHTRAELFEGETKVCDFVLATVENNELLDYHIKFSNGEQELIAKHIPVFDKIINFKY